MTIVAGLIAAAAPAGAAAGERTTVVSVSSTGEQGVGSSNGGVLSADGRYVAWEGIAPNLVPGDTNGVSDVFVRDRRTGRTERVSLTSAGGQLSNHSYSASISADGRYVAFVTAAGELVPGEPKPTLIFVRDRRTGVTELVSTSSAEVPANYECALPAISGDGRFVAFETYASGLIPGDTNDQSDIYLRDRWAGTTTRVSVSSRGRQGNESSRNAAISGDGRFVAFGSYASNLVGGDTNATGDIFVRERWTGRTTRVNTSTAGRQSDVVSDGPAISADGRYVGFLTESTTLVPGVANGRQHVFLKDLASGTTSRISVSSTGTQANGHSFGVGISADGRYVSFGSDATNLAPGDIDEASNVFVRDRRTGTTIGVAPGGTGDRPAEFGLFPSAISGDGRSVAFSTGAPEFVPPNTSGSQVVIWDRR